MNTQQEFPYMYIDTVGTYGTIKDFNQANTSGFYKVSGLDSSIINAPSGNGYGTLEVVDAADYILQRYVSRNKEISVRHNINNSWYSWQRIDNFGYNTLAELASGMGIGIKKQYSLEPGGEADLEVSYAGLYVLTNSESGNAAMCLVSSYPEGLLSEIGSTGSGTRFSTSLTAEGLICFGRKTTNGNLFLVNNRTSSVTVVVRYYT